MQCLASDVFFRVRILEGFTVFSTLWLVFYDWWCQHTRSRRRQDGPFQVYVQQKIASFVPLRKTKSSTVSAVGLASGGSTSVGGVMACALAASLPISFAPELSRTEQTTQSGLFHGVQSRHSRRAFRLSCHRRRRTVLFGTIIREIVYSRIVPGIG